MLFWTEYSNMTFTCATPDMSKYTLNSTMTSYCLYLLKILRVVATNKQVSGFPFLPHLFSLSVSSSPSQLLVILTPIIFLYLPHCWPPSDQSRRCHLPLFSSFTPLIPSRQSTGTLTNQAGHTLSFSNQCTERLFNVLQKTPVQ